MLFSKVLRWACDAHQLATLREVSTAGCELRAARHEADELYDVLLGDGPGGPSSWSVIQYMIPAYRRDVIPIRRRADVARHRLGNALRFCRLLGVPRWQVRLALVC